MYTHECEHMCACSVCLRMCIYVQVYEHGCVCSSLCLCVIQKHDAHVRVEWACMNTCVYLNVCEHMCVHVPMCLPFACVCTCGCLCTCVWVLLMFMSTCLHVCMHVSLCVLLPLQQGKPQHTQTANQSTSKLSSLQEEPITLLPLTTPFRMWGPWPSQAPDLRTSITTPALVESLPLWCRNVEMNVAVCYPGQKKQVLILSADDTGLEVRTRGF